MKTVKLIQTQLSALCDQIVDTTEIGNFASVALAQDWLIKRSYTYDGTAWVQGNAVQYPVQIEEKEVDIFDIASFV